MKMKQSLLMFLLAMVAVLLVACGSDDKKNEDASSGDAKPEEKTEVVVNHEYGETKVAVNPKKVVVFDYGSLDTIDALGVGDAVAALPRQGVPSYLSQYDTDDYINAGGLKEPDFEAINEVQPDLIIISSRQADSYDQFAEIAPTIYMAVDTKDYMNSFEKNVNTLAQIFDKEDVAKEKLEAIETSIEEVKGKTTDDKKGLIVLSNAGELSAYGVGSRFGIIHDVLGVVPVDEGIKVSTHGDTITSEYILEKNPDYLFVVDRDAVVGGEVAAKETVENEIVKKTNAYKDGKIVYLDPNYWYLSGGGIESVSEMIKSISEGIAQ